MTPTLYFVARLLLGGAFIFFGIRNLTNIPALEKGIAARGVPNAGIAAWIGVLLQLATGVLIVTGATGLIGVLGGIFGIVFVYVAAWLFHAFWMFPKDEQRPHVQAWIMNTALAGAFLMVIATSI